MNEWRQDLGRVLDALSQRQDIDATRIAYYGLSFGGSMAVPLVALEDRLKVAVLGPAGFAYRFLPPEADAINYVSRVKIPVLMLGGRHDYIFPLETSQKPMFDRIGTPADQKRHVVFESGHVDFPRSELIREVLGWLDRYLGPVGNGNVIGSEGFRRPGARSPEVQKPVFTAPADSPAAFRSHRCLADSLDGDDVRAVGVLAAADQHSRALAAGDVVQKQVRWFLPSVSSFSVSRAVNALSSTEQLNLTSTWVAVEYV